MSRDFRIRRPTCARTLGVLLAFLLVGTTTRQGLLAEDAPAVIPTTAELLIAPAEVHLHGPRSRQQLLVSAQVRSGQFADWTRDVTYESIDPGVVEVSATGLATARGDGQTEIVVRSANATTRLSVIVTGFGEPDPVAFRTEVVAALARGGCSQGACHGSPQGKNGFRLSLRGHNPDLDLRALAREAFGRRTNALAPDQSLCLLKATGQVPHRGGKRFSTADPAYAVLRDWILQGCQDQNASRKLVRLQVLPGKRRLHTSSPRQQLVARAYFHDGSVRDVTDLAVFTSSDEASAPVTAGGLVEFQQTCEATILVRYLDRVVGAPLTYVLHDPQYVPQFPDPVNYIDDLVFARQRELQVTSAALCSDEVFLRRVYLDLIGTLPTPDEARDFLDSSDPARRERLIDGLLARPEYASFWALKWADVMRGNRETIRERGVHSLHRWLVGNISEDRPWNEVAREVITALGNPLHEPAANFYRISPAPEDAAESISQLFLGVRIQCARCHNHPYESITQDDYFALAAYFARVRVHGERFGLDDVQVSLAPTGEVRHPVTSLPVTPAAFGTNADVPKVEDDRREKLADWLTSPTNPWFARSIVNRIWYHLLGRGIVEPIDDFRDTNPPSNPELLDALAREFVEAGFRAKPVLRSILLSRVYQLSAVPPEGVSPNAADAERYFARALVHMLSAEQVLDAISASTQVAEPFEGYPLGTRAMELPEGGVSHYFLRAFAKPVRDVACECARESEPSLNEVLHLLNNAGVLAKSESPSGLLGRAIASGKTTLEIIELLYLASLSRRPSPRESEIAQDFISRSADVAAGLRDLQQALLNSNEFLLRH